MEPHIDLPRALIRGRYMKAVAAMERYGVPIDVDLLERLKLHWDSIKDILIVAVDKNIGVYEGTSFRTKLFAEYLRKHNIIWPRLESGRLDLKKETFRAMGRAHPELIWPLYELRCVLGKLRLNDLQIGSDGRNRAWLNPFGSRSSRNQPSSNKFIFGPSAWLRCLIKPGPGYAVAYCAYEQQEFGIAAVLSGDEAMIKAYLTGDPYLEFGKLAGDIPPDGTKKSHGAQRALFKQCVLATQYGQGARGLAARINKATVIASRLLHLNRQVFARFWQWSDHIVDHVMLGNRIYTTLGWRRETFVRWGDEDVNPRSVRNFPMQANGAEMMRLACCFAIKDSVELVAPVHDGSLIHAPVDQIDEMSHVRRNGEGVQGHLVWL